MLVTIRSKNKLELEPKVKAYAENKLVKLENYFTTRDNPEANVLCKEYPEAKAVEITIPTKNIILRAEVKGESFYEAIDLAVDKLEGQIKRHKSKIYSSMKRREGLSNYYATENDFNPEQMKEDIMDSASNLVKNKKLELKPMTVDDAITQMELLGHDFFIFLNVETNKVSVVYLREDYDYGIIETNM